MSFFNTSFDAWKTRAPDDEGPTWTPEPPKGQCSECKRHGYLYLVSGKWGCGDCASGVYRCRCCAVYQVDECRGLCGQCQAEETGADEC